MAQIDFVSKLLNYWNSNGVAYSFPLSNGKSCTLGNINIKLPNDFQELYNNVNGSVDCDHNGFMFYRCDGLITMGEKFSLKRNDGLYNVVVFIDYMQASWWYGVSIKGDSYEIGIIANEKRFKPITNSLETFIDLYVNDSELLYDYG